MILRVLTDPDKVARAAAEIIAAEARAAVAARGRFIAAISGGRTPWEMLRMLAKADLPREGIYFAQVDERIAPFAHPDRNLTHMSTCLPAAHGQVLAMPVEQPDLEAAAAEYGDSLRRVAGQPIVFDLIHLGLGVDGHTASLVPDDPVLDVVDKDVAITGEYQGRRRMTLTFPAISRARRILWVVTGGEKAAMLARLRARDEGIPAGRVSQERGLVLADRAASEKL